MATNLVAKYNTDLLFSSYGDQKSKMSLNEIKSSCLQGCVPSGGTRGELFSCLFQALEAGMAASVYTSSNAGGIFLTEHTLTLSMLCLRLPYLRSLVITLGPSR